MSKSQGWVPNFPGEMRVWEVAATAGVIGGLVFVNVRQEPAYLVQFLLSLVIVAVCVVRTVRDHRHFGWQSFVPALGWILLVPTLVAIGGVVWAVLSLTDRSLEWAVLASLVCAGIALLSAVLVQEGMRKDPRALRFQRSPMGAPVRG